MTITLTKYFNFSASFSHAPSQGSVKNKIVAHNYRLGVTMDGLDAKSESETVQKIENALIKKIDSKDLGLHVDFLSAKDLTEAGLLKAFYELIQKEINPARVHALSLARDDKSRLDFVVERKQT